MERRGNIFKTLFITAIFIFLEIAVLTILHYSSDLQKMWISKQIHGVVGTIWGETENVKYYFSLKEKNDELAQRNFDLEQRLRHYEDITHNITFSDTIVSSVAGSYSYTPAVIRKLSSNKQHNYIILSKGSNDGIEPQSGIITEKGVVGIIESVSKNYSYAIAFTNTDLTISARIGKTGSVGTLSWDGRKYNSAMLEGIPCHITIEKGDTVYTSGYSDLFPPDIPLGISKSMDILNGATYQIEVELFENYSALKYVTVVKNIDSDEIKSLENELD